MFSTLPFRVWVLGLCSLDLPFLSMFFPTNAFTLSPFQTKNLSFFNWFSIFLSPSLSKQLFFSYHFCYSLRKFIRLFNIVSDHILPKRGEKNTYGPAELTKECRLPLNFRDCNCLEYLLTAEVFRKKHPFAAYKANLSGNV